MKIKKGSKILKGNHEEIEGNLNEDKEIEKLYEILNDKNSIIGIRERIHEIIEKYSKE